MKIPLKLSQKLYIGICLIIALIMLSILSVGHFSIIQAIEEKTEKNLLKAKEIFIFFQQSRFRDLLTSGKIVAEIPYLRSVMTTPEIDHATILDTAQSTQKIIKSDLMMLADNQGKLLASITEPERSGDMMLQEPGFTQTLKGENYWGIWVRPSGIYQVVGTPMVFGEEVMGAVLIGYEINSEVLDKLARMTNCAVALISPNKVISSSGISMDTIKRWTASIKHHPYEQFVKSGTSDVDLLASIPLMENGHSGFFILADSLNQELSFFNQLQTKFLLVGLAILMMALALGILYSQTITRPVEELVEATKRIAQGDLSSQVPIDSNDEIGQLAISFNQMVNNLEKTTFSKEYVDKIIASMINSVVVLSNDRRIRMVNLSTLQLTGYREEELVGQPITVLLAQDHMSNRPDEEIVFNNIFEEQFVSKDGKKISVLFSASLIKTKEGQNQGIVCVAQDITILKQAEGALRLSEERYALAASGANDGLWDWNLKKNKIYFSPRWKSMLGYSNVEIGEDPQEWFNRIHPEDISRVRRSLESLENDITQSLLEVEYQILHKNGNYLWGLTRGIAVRNGTGICRMVGSQTDITQRKQYEEQLRYDALHDKLTGLPNRTLLLDRLSHLIERSKRHSDYLFAVLFIDFDRFKVVNDSLGHLIGDQLIIKISERVKKCIRSGDTLTRLGGDEFVVLMDDINNVEDSIRIAERIQKEISNSFKLAGQDVFITASIGITVNSHKSEKPEDLIRDADTAMYRAKSLGKARYEIFQEDMHQRAVHILNLEGDLRQAIEKKELYLNYQPIVSIKDGHLTGMEALIRWHHPQRGLVSPSDFIPLAEETGMILNIGEWVIRTALNQCKEWREAGYPQHLAINFSAKQFQYKGLINFLKETIQATKADALTLEIEITESVAMQDVDFSVQTLRELQKLGFQISIDDFGTGYSSLGCLQILPLNSLKIDRCFVQNLLDNQGNATITKTIIMMAHNLGFKVIAEGVETKEQLDFLRQNRCDEAQGFLICKPLPADEIFAFIKHHQNKLI